MSKKPMLTAWILSPIFITLGLSQNILANEPAVTYDSASPRLIAQAPDVASLHERVQTRSDKIKEYRALLNNPDQTIRLAALDEMTRSPDPTMREIAFEAGFNSADMAMQAIALHAKLRLTETLTVELTKPVSDAKSVQGFVSKYGYQYTMTFSDFKDENGSFKVQWVNFKGAGQVSGANLSWKVAYSVYYMTAEFRLEDGATLKGNISWGGSEQMPAVIRLH